MKREMRTLGGLVDDGNDTVVFLNFRDVDIVAVKNINDSVNHSVGWVWISRRMLPNLSSARQTNFWENSAKLPAQPTRLP